MPVVGQAKFAGPAIPGCWAGSFNMPLDINTENGRVAAAWQAEAADIVFGANPDINFYSTSDHSAAKVDGVLVAGGSIVGVVEIKSRSCTYEQLMTSFNGDWLLSEEKLRDVAIVSGMLCVPGYGVLYLVQSRVCLVTRLSDAEGNVICNYRVERTTTQATCNGGTAQRLNAFIDMRRAKLYR